MAESASKKTAKDRSLPLEALQKALAANQALQNQILSEIQAIGREKGSNRKRAAELSLFVGHDDASSSSSSSSSPGVVVPTCRWTNTYFMDPQRKNLPEANEDQVRRDDAEAKSFFASRNPLWTPVDNRQMKKIMQEKQRKTQQQTIDFESMASQMSGKKVKRTAEECRIQVRNLQKTTQPWTDDELNKLRQIIEKRRSSNDDAPIIDWQDCADKMGPDRTTTAWETFLAYQTHIAKPKPGAWTPEQDEFLLKFVAAMGPQFVVNGANVTFLVARFLPDKNKNQIFARVNHLLLNPKLVNEAWAEGDERKLALCMKVYSEAESKKQALYLAGGHLPWRAPGSVLDKWERSLNPAFSVGPFSKKEDEDLLAAMRANPGMGWKEISVKYFPHRHPHRIMNRWSEIAQDKDILDRYGSELLKQGQDGTDETATAGESADTAEYVVKVKRARRS